MTTVAKITTNQEYANLVPPLSAEEYDSLKQSIKQNGLWVPIILNSQGVILDGHHRFKACQELGIEPKTVTKDFPENDKLHEQIFVIDSNLHRRHLNNFQRTELALKSKSILQEIAKQNQKAGGKKIDAASVRNLTQVGNSDGSESAAIAGGVVIGGRVDEQIAKLAGVSRDTVRKVEAIQEAVQKKPNLKYIVERARRGEMSVNEVDGIIKDSEDEATKNAKWRKIREQVLKEDNYKCRNCGDEFHLRVYPISDVFEDKHIPENLETLCKDCHNIKKKFFGEFGLVNSFVYMFQELTDMSGKRYFQYNTIGSLDSKKESNDYMRKWLEESEKNPYSKLKKSSYAELVSKTRSVREQLIQSMPLGDYSVSITQQVLSQLLPVLRDYQEMVDKEADERRRKHEMSKR